MNTSIVEVMSSIQGEGLFVGCRQVFIRFLGCNLNCSYCDTPASLTEARQCRIEKTPGQRDFITRENPLTPEELAAILNYYELAKHHSISLTGGEPLLQASFLKMFIPLINGQGPKMFLETNGTLPKMLAQVVDLIDIISMDIKLEGNTAWETYREFLQIACGKQLYVKIVILPDTTNADISKAAQLIAAVNPAIPLILQPVTPYGPVRRSPTPSRMLAVQELALNWLQDVRVIPQTHKIMGQL